MGNMEYSVSEAVRLIGVESHVLRYWEEELQIAVCRNSQGHRIYTEEDIETFRRVRRLKEKGLQLKAIRLLLDQTAKQESGEQEEFARQIQGIMEPEREAEDDSNAGYEVVMVGQARDNLQQFEQILRRLMEEVVSEQNEKLEDAITERMRRELEEFYLSCSQIIQEAAAASEPAQRPAGRVGRALRRLFGGFGRYADDDR